MTRDATSGGNGPRVQHLIRLNDWHIVQILATHLHIDHIFGVHFLTKAYGCPFGASPLDNDWIDRAPDRCREVGLEVRMPFVSPTFSLAHGDTVRFGSESLSVLSVPGHSPGSLVFYSSSARCLFSGDTLFRGGIGRTDLPGGNRRLLTESIRHQLLRFPDDTAVYPGHYEPTTVGAEKAMLL